MRDFYLTFGQRYRMENHPRDERAHPDGWFRIEAVDEGEARRIAYTALGEHWANIYPAEDFASDVTYYDRGELAVLTMEEEPPC